MAVATDERVTRVLEMAGQTYADEAGIRLADRPAALYQTLVLATLLSARIKADIGVAAARELFAAGMTTPERMAAASWQQRVDALGRGHYRRYDERTSSMLGDAAAELRDRWRGDLRRMRDEADGDPRALRDLLKQLKGIGDVGVDIFFREAQVVWPALRPFVDRRALVGAERLGLPTDPDRVAGLVADDDLARFVAGLVRVSLNKGLVESVAGR